MATAFVTLVNGKGVEQRIDADSIVQAFRHLILSESPAVNVEKVKTVKEFLSAKKLTGRKDVVVTAYNQQEGKETPTTGKINLVDLEKNISTAEKFALLPVWCMAEISGRKVAQKAVNVEEVNLPDGF